MLIIQIIKTWYRGKYIPPPQNDIDGSVTIISPGYYEKPVFARFLCVVGLFLSNHWKWLVSSALVLVSIIVTLLKK